MVIHVTVRRRLTAVIGLEVVLLIQRNTEVGLEIKKSKKKKNIFLNLPPLLEHALMHSCGVYMTESLLLIWRYEYALKSLNYTHEEIMNNNYKLPMYNMDTSLVVLYLLICCWMRVH